MSNSFFLLNSDSVSCVTIQRGGASSLVLVGDVYQGGGCAAVPPLLLVLEGDRLLLPALPPAPRGHRLTQALKLKYILETGNDVHTRAVRLRLILFSKNIGAFYCRSKVLVDFLHSFTQINELTGAIIARHILRRIYLHNNYNYTILHNIILRLLAETEHSSVPGSESTSIRIPHQLRLSRIRIQKQ